MIHRNYDDLGSEFIIEHEKFHAKSWLLYLVVATFLSLVTFKLHLWHTNVLLAFVFVLLLGLVYRLYTKITAEKLLVLPSLGVQLSTEYFLGRTDTHFIQSHQIQDIVINEAVSMQGVTCYLAVLIHQEADQPSNQVSSLVPLFVKSSPSLSTLKEVYRITQSKMFAHSKKVC